MIQLRKDEVEREEDDLLYGYGFFHLVFSLGAIVFRNAIHQLEIGEFDKKVSWLFDKAMCVCVFPNTIV